MHPENISPDLPFIPNTKLVFKYMTSSGTHPLNTMRPDCKKGKKNSETKCQKNEKYFYIKILKTFLTYLTD
jgi:hypothetical protein